MDAVVNTLKSVFSDCGIEAVDPITTNIHEYAEISDDVVQGIHRSDAMFVIEYPPVLNTSYEAGIAFALGIPSFHWLPDHRPVQERDGLQEYLRYLGYRDGAIGLPTDQGDRRYYQFPGNIALSRDAQTQFIERVKLCLDSLLDGPLSEHTIRARRKHRNAAHLGVSLLRQYTNNKALSWILNSLITQHQMHLQNGQGARRFEIDESIYPTFLSTLGEDDESAKRVIAVADISSNIERFWFKGGTKHIVGARIFRLPWETFYSVSEMNKFLRIARDLAEVYPVYVTDSDTRDAYLQRLRSGVSGDFVVFDSVVGYYQREHSNDISATKLVVEYNERLSSDLTREFERAREVSVQIRPSSTVAGIKREWFKVRKIGEWSENYEGGTHRDDRYYDNYDKHIRAWIPNYEDLVSKVAGSLISALTTANINGKALVGEIGMGTGAVTSIVAGWCDAVERAKFKPIAKYVYVDTSDEMCNSTEAALARFATRGMFHKRRNLDFPGLRDGAAGQRYDVICGCLILHYIVDSTDHAAGWTQFFAELDTVLDPKGVAIFGGCFFDLEKGEQQRQVEWWQHEIERGGLESSVARQFVDANTEMQAMPPASIIEERSGGLFQARFERIGPRSSPFGVISLARRAPI